jgi:hypothetical protein
MNTFRSTIIVSILGLMTIISEPVFAGPYGDDMAKCLVKSTTDADKGTLVKWMFAAISLNPEVKSMVTLTDKQRDGYNKSFATLVMKLLTESCKKETQQAIQYEGREAIGNSFRVLGAVAARGLMSHPDVTAYIAGIDKYVDTKKLEALKNSGK